MYGSSKNAPRLSQRPNAGTSRNGNGAPNGTCNLKAKRENIFWGPCNWKTIHSVAATYNPSKRSAFLRWIKAYADLLPCEKCSRHMKENLKVLPPEEYLDSREDLFRWSYRFHDLVNRTKDYPTTSPPFDTIKNYYFDGLYNCEKCSV